MKPRSIRLFDLFFWIGVALVLLSAALGWDQVTAQATQITGRDAGNLGQGIWMASASVLIFVLLAGIVWLTISPLRTGIMRWVLAAAVAYAAWANADSLFKGHLGLADFIDLGATVFLALSFLVLLRPDARAWFAPADGGTFDQI